MLRLNKLCSLLGSHLTKGSPVKPAGQLQIGLWLITWHLAMTPHEPAQGFIHLWLLHAWFFGQSELTVHSGLQEGGVPMKLGTQEHTACSFITRQILLDPQGEGLQGSSGPKIDDIEKKRILEFYIYYTINESTHTFAWTTRKKSVSCHSRQAAAHRNMIVYVALCIFTTSSGTWIYAFIANASSR